MNHYRFDLCVGRALADVPRWCGEKLKVFHVAAQQARSQIRTNQLLKKGDHS